MRGSKIGTYKLTYLNILATVLSLYGNSSIARPFDITKDTVAYCDFPAGIEGKPDVWFRYLKSSNSFMTNFGEVDPGKHSDTYSATITMGTGLAGDLGPNEVKEITATTPETISKILASENYIMRYHYRYQQGEGKSFKFTYNMASREWIVYGMNYTTGSSVLQLKPELEHVEGTLNCTIE